MGGLPAGDRGGKHELPSGCPRTASRETKSVRFTIRRSDELSGGLLGFEFLDPLFDRFLIEAPVRAHLKGRNSTIF